MNITSVLSALAAVICVSNAGAQSYPDKPVHLVIQGSAAGTTYDVAATIAKKLSQIWSQPVNVEAKGGGGKMALDTIGGVAKSPPDGHRLLLLSGTYAAIPSLYANLPYDPVKDFIPVASLVAQPNILVVGRTAGINSVSELVASAKAKPGQLTSGSTGVGSANHLVGETFKLATGIDVAHVPLGVKQVIDAVISGQVNAQPSFNPDARHESGARGLTARWASEQTREP